MLAIAAAAAAALLDPRAQPGPGGGSGRRRRGGGLSRRVRSVASGRAAQPRRRAEQMQLASARDRVATAGHAELAVDLLEVRLDRVDRDVELAGDLPVGHDRREVAQDRQLTLGENVHEDRCEAAPGPAALQHGDELGRERPVRRGAARVPMQDREQLRPGAEQAASQVVALGSVECTLDRRRRGLVVQQRVAGHRSQRLRLDAHGQGRTGQCSVQKALARSGRVLLEQQHACAEHHELGRVVRLERRARPLALSRCEQDPRVVRAQRGTQRGGDRVAAEAKMPDPQCGRRGARLPGIEQHARALERERELQAALGTVAQRGFGPVERARGARRRRAIRAGPRPGPGAPARRRGRNRRRRRRPAR